MNFLKHFVLTMVMVFAFAFSAQATGMYIEPKIGGAQMIGTYLDTEGVSGSSDFSTFTNLVGAIAVGYDWSEYFGVDLRTDVEYAIRTTGHFDAHGRSVEAYVPQTLMFNVYYDFKNSTDFTPYIGGGIGAAFVGENSNFAWNVGTGVGYKINDDFTASLGYRFVSLGEFEDVDRKTSGMLYSHEVMLGLRYTF